MTQMDIPAVSQSAGCCLWTMVLTVWNRVQCAVFALRQVAFLRGRENGSRFFIFGL